MEGPPADLARGRALTVRCAQHLQLLGFQVGPGKPIFGPAISTYADMLDPHSTDERRLAACRRYLQPVGRYADMEELRDDLPYGRDRVDPYRRDLRTTLRGALLRIVEADFAEAVACFELAGLVNERAGDQQPMK